MGKDGERVAKGEERGIGSKEEDDYGDVDTEATAELRISHNMLHNM